MSKTTSKRPVPDALADTDATASDRFNQWKNTDPLPNILPALLNSADILAYVKATSLIYPFDSKKLKGASYDASIKGDVIYWDDNGVKQKASLENDGDSFDLSPNSIAFVTLEPTFRIPNYLALRFNLKISHIYKGLLLGTGPLVDPGFVGRLSIPLHNLTSNTYRFFKGDELITIEFTKMSANKQWNKSIQMLGHNETYIENEIPPQRTVEEYIAKALKKDRLSSVISSIPGAMMESKKDVRIAQEAVKAVEKKASFQAAVSIIAVCTLVISAISLAFSAFNKANERYDSLISEYATLEQKYETRISSIEEQLSLLETTVTISPETNGANSSIN